MSLLVISDVEEIGKKIETMEIRGARDIAKAAARGLKITAEKTKADDAEELVEELEEASNVLQNTRPTAVSLANALRYVRKDVEELSETENLSSLKEYVVSRADEFIEKSDKVKEKIGEIGSRRISDGDTIMTHCNSSCAIAVIKTAYEKGKDIEVYANETRPRKQGHITVRELRETGISTTLIVDSAARYFMKKMDKFIVGADSIAANGAVVNKIGTSQIALAAHEARVVSFVAAESYKFHPSTLVGELIEIEERDHSEVADPEELNGANIRNPAFDVTPAEYIDLIITERGIIPPEAAYEILQEQFELGFEAEELV